MRSLAESFNFLFTLCDKYYEMFKFHHYHTSDQIIFFFSFFKFYFRDISPLFFRTLEVSSHSFLFSFKIYLQWRVGKRGRVYDRDKHVEKEEEEKKMKFVTRHETVANTRSLSFNQTQSCEIKKESMKESLRYVYFSSTAFFFFFFSLKRTENSDISISAQKPN